MDISLLGEPAGIFNIQGGFLLEYTANLRVEVGKK